MEEKDQASVGLKSCSTLARPSRMCNLESVLCNRELSTKDALLPLIGIVIPGVRCSEEIADFLQFRSGTAMAQLKSLRGI